MHHLETQIEIDAPAERVWSLLIDFPSYPRWNPFIRSIEGTLGVGQSLTVFIQPPGARGMRFRPTVLAAQPNRELRWKGRLLLQRLFVGEEDLNVEKKPGR